MGHKICSGIDCRFNSLVGKIVFHGHYAAVSTARVENNRAGRKKVKVIVRKNHFLIVPSETTF